MGRLLRLILSRKIYSPIPNPAAHNLLLFADVAAAVAAVVAWCLMFKARCARRAAREPPDLRIVPHVSDGWPFVTPDVWHHAFPNVFVCFLNLSPKGSPNRISF